MATSERPGPLTDATDPSVAARAVADLAGETLSDLDGLVPSVLGGSWAAASSYVTAYRSLTANLLDAMLAERPDREGQVSRTAIEVVERAAVQAPFSPWVGIAGTGPGIGLEVLSRLREVIGQLDPLSLPADRPASRFLETDPEDVRRFARLVMQELDGDQPPLRRMADVFALSATELGRLFGVSRQAAAQWLEEGPPRPRQAKAVTVAAIADILDRRLKRSRIPGVVRRPAEAYDGRTALELIEADRQEWLLQSVRASFDYAATA